MTDAWAFMQAEMAKKPRVNPNVRVLGGTPLEGISDIPMSPADPGWKAKIPPPADPGPGTAVPAPVVGRTDTPVSIGDARLTIYYSRRGYSVAIERKPDWEIDGSPIYISAAAIQEFLPILEKIIKIKDTTGELYVPHAEEQSSDERGVPGARPRDAKPRKVRTQARQAKGDATARADHAADRPGSHPPGPGLEAGDAPLPGSSVHTDPEGEDTRVVNQFEEPKLREEFERKAKAEAYKKQVALRSRYGLNDAEDARVGASRDSGG